MIFRSVTSRLVFSYCLLLVLLGGAFLAFTVLSFQHYTRETIASTLAVRAQEIWNLSQGSLDQPARLADTIERRFSPESQDRFIRIRAGSRLLYRSGEPIGKEFAANTVALRDIENNPEAPRNVRAGCWSPVRPQGRSDQGLPRTVDHS